MKERVFTCGLLAAGQRIVSKHKSLTAKNSIPAFGGIVNKAIRTYPQIPPEKSMIEGDEVIIENLKTKKPLFGKGFVIICNAW